MNAKRRLPSWTLGASTTNKASKPLDVDANEAITKKETSVVTESLKPKAKRVSRKHKKEDSFPGEKNFLVKCETKRKKRGCVEKDVNESHDSEQEVVLERKKRGRVGRKAEESDPSRKKKEKSYEFERNNENQDPLCDDEDDDLTMDDVLSIAKEFVENDKSETGPQKPIEGHCRLKTKSLSSCTSSAATKTSLVAPQVTRSPVHEENISRNSIENTSKDAIEDFRMTGDPAQDMLELFLGPLLKKPIVKEVATSSTNDILLPHEIKNKKQHVISDNPVTMLKKKSSLRDAVAMLLD